MFTKKKEGATVLYIDSTVFPSTPLPLQKTTPKNECIPGATQNEEHRHTHCVCHLLWSTLLGIPGSKK